MPQPPIAVWLFAAGLTVAGASSCVGPRRLHCRRATTPVERKTDRPNPKHCMEGRIPRRPGLGRRPPDDGANRAIDACFVRQREKTDRNLTSADER